MHHSPSSSWQALSLSEKIFSVSRSSFLTQKHYREYRLSQIFRDNRHSSTGCFKAEASSPQYHPSSINSCSFFRQEEYLFADLQSRSPRRASVTWWSLSILMYKEQSLSVMARQSSWEAISAFKDPLRSYSVWRSRSRLSKGFSWIQCTRDRAAGVSRAWCNIWEAAAA